VVERASVQLVDVVEVMLVVDLEPKRGAVAVHPRVVLDVVRIVIAEGSTNVCSRAGHDRALRRRAHAERTVGPEEVGAGISGRYEPTLGRRMVERAQ
jgi:hypothetical protein